jgi:hypothetical protein
MSASRADATGTLLRLGLRQLDLPLRAIQAAEDFSVGSHAVKFEQLRDEPERLMRLGQLLVYHLDDAGIHNPSMYEAGEVARAPARGGRP